MVGKANVAQDVTNQTFQIGSFAATSSGAGAAGTVTLHRVSGRITTPSLTGAAGTSYADVTNTHAAASDGCIVTVNYADAATGRPLLRSVATTNGTMLSPSER
jgi:hypothetical protein